MSIPDAQKKKTDAKKITANWSNLRHQPSDSEVMSAAQLAQEGLITSVENMWLNLSKIPHEQIGKLASIVRERVYIVNISPTTCLDIIMDSVRCPVLEMLNMSLAKPQTQALVSAMRERVGTVELYDVTLDIKTLCLYNGRGRCRELQVASEKRTRYAEILRRWVKEVAWSVTVDDNELLIMKRELKLQKSFCIKPQTFQSDYSRNILS